MKSDYATLAYIVGSEYNALPTNHNISYAHEPGDQSRSKSDPKLADKSERGTSREWQD